MDPQRYSIEELADAAGVTRRGIRFYVQQGLLPAPLGVGRGRHYDATHVERLRRVKALQAGGHSLEEIRQILEGKGVVAEEEEATPRAARAVVQPALRAELWRRVRVVDGVELSFDAARYEPTVEALIELRGAIEKVFGRERS